jgi:chromate transporter
LAEPPQPSDSIAAQADPADSASLLALARVFITLGLTSFGGPAAHVALMETEVVRRRRWLSHEEFLDLLAAANLIPGPNSTELAIHVGWRRAGWRGLIVAGLCFILPAVAATWGMAWAYVRWGKAPGVRGPLLGAQPVMIAIVTLALARLAPTALRGRDAICLAGMCLALLALGIDELAVLLVGGTAMAAWRRLRWKGLPTAPAAVALLLPIWMGAASASAANVFLAFLKIGSVLFGSGYVLLSFLHSEFVEQRGWLSSEQLLDAVAAGQVTPGPVFSTATFVGYVLAGNAGAALATAGIFLPAFVFVALSGPLVPRIRRSPIAAAFLDGVNVAALCLMAWVSLELGHAALHTPFAWAVAAISLLLLGRTTINSAWLIAAGALLGMIGIG